MNKLEKAPGDWYEHGFTAKLRKHVEGQREMAFTELLAACRKSTDPQVAKHSSKYEEIGSFLNQLTKVNAHGSRDDGDD